MRIERHHQPEQEPAERARNFEEVVFNYDLETAKAEAARCIRCKNAPCKDGCPVNVQIPEFLAEIVKGDIMAAAAVIKKTNNLPAVCGRVCPQEEQCEKVCVRRRMEGSVAIGALERFAADYALENGAAAADKASALHSVNIKTPDAGKAAAEKSAFKGSVGVVGSGPAGLTVAADCAAAGLSVTVYEAFHEPGGVLVYGIPEFRLPKVLVRKEIEKLQESGAVIELNTVVGKTVTVKQLLEKHDAVFIGSGAGLPQFLRIPGENLNRIYSANEFLTRVNLMKAYLPGSATPITRGYNIAVFGAGNVAMDAARTALRLGAPDGTKPKVSVIYRRGRGEMPARQEEIRHAEEEGIELVLLTAPLEFTGESGRVTGVKCVKCELGLPDASGRRSPVPVPGSEYIIPCDTAIIAVGTSPNPIIKDSLPELQTDKKGIIIVDENMKTGVPRVYAGGDSTTGAATVILAMGAGKKAAESIIRQITGA